MTSPPSGSRARRLGALISFALAAAAAVGYFYVGPCPFTRWFVGISIGIHLLGGMLAVLAD